MVFHAKVLLAAVLPFSFPAILYQWASWMNGSCIYKKVRGGCFRGRKSVGKTVSRWENAVWSDAIDLLQVRNCKAAA